MYAVAVVIVHVPKQIKLYIIIYGLIYIVYVDYEVLCILRALLILIVTIKSA